MGIEGRGQQQLRDCLDLRGTLKSGQVIDHSPVFALTSLARMN